MLSSNWFAKDAGLAGIIDAIHRSQAVIEFTTDGKILTANENFLTAMGYTLAELNGQHHGLFVDPEYRASAAYRQFWDKLKRGEYDSGQYRRVRKDGTGIWLQAAYNPVLDRRGKVVKVVLFATDITA